MRRFLRYISLFLSTAVSLVAVCDDENPDISSGGSALLRLMARGTTIGIYTSIIKGDDTLYLASEGQGERLEISGYTCVKVDIQFLQLAYYDKTKGKTLFEEIQEKIITDINGFLDSSVGSTAGKAQICAVAAQVASANNAAYASALSRMMTRCIASFPDITPDDVKILRNLDSRLDKIAKSLDNTKGTGNAQDGVNNLRRELTTLTSQVDSLRKRIANAPTKEDIDRLRPELDAKMKELTKGLVTISMMNKAIEEVRKVKKPEIVAISGGDVGFSNMVAEVSLYLGADKADMTNSLAFTPPKLRGKRQDEGDEESEGEVAENIIAYLNSYGVVAFDDGDGDGENGFENRFSLEKSGASTNVTATFGAPVNWVDGDTIKVDDNGKYYADPPQPPVTTPWHWDGTNGFLRPYVYAGNQIVSASGADVSSVGTYYVHVSIGEGAQGVVVSATVNKNSSEGQNEWVFWVGTLESVPVEGGGTETKCTSELGVMPIILCYE